LYAVLRSVTNKLLGIFLIFCFVFVLFILPFILKNTFIRSGSFRPFFALSFWSFVVVCLLLGWIGSLPVMSPYILIGQFLTVMYFVILLVVFPLNNFFEKLVYDVYVWRGSKYFGVEDGIRVSLSRKVGFTRWDLFIR